METDGVGLSDVKSSPKSKSKKKSLCSLLMQKRTKVGCLSADSDDLSLGNVPSDCNHGNKLLLHKSLSNGALNLKSERSESLMEYGSTKMTLCCAMTEGSSHAHRSGHHLSGVDWKPNSKQDNITCDARSISKTSSDTSRTLSLEEKSPSKSFVMESGNSNLKNEGEESELKVHSKCASPTHSGRSSRASSLTNLFSEQQTQKCYLSKRRSVDNLLSELNPPCRISCTSFRSMPDSYQNKMKSTSQDTVLPWQNNYKNSKIPSESETTIGTGLSTAPSHKFVASMDSLARHSLLAAEVLHLIPTIKARERNFLHGRIAANSLLGSLELERTLPHRELRIFVGTWNMNGQSPPQELNDFILPSILEHVPDMIVVGTQESYSERFEWEVSIQEALGPSHLLFHSAALGTLHLAVFIRRDLLWFCSGLHKFYTYLLQHCEILHTFCCYY